ncbi:MAG: tetratricopeptide repeat protein [Deltaproteobacteria bacterium]|nr:tetratricopeptide repeat protein [Deltaproteobacteria bacterium]
MESTNDLFNMILANGQPSPETFFLVLSRMKEKGQLEDVVRESKRALTLFPHDLQIRRLLAEAYFDLGRTSQAEEEIGRVTEQITHLVSAYKFQARILQSQGKESEAARVLQFYLMHHANDEEALQFMDTLRPQHEMPIPAEDALEEMAISDRKGLLEIATPTLAEIYFDQGQLSEAIEIYEKVVSQNPDDTHSKQRLEDLKAMAQAEQRVMEDKEKVNVMRQKKEKLLSVLNAWQDNIRENLGRSASSA